MDVTAHLSSSIVLLTAHTDAAEEWIEKNLIDPIRYGPSVAIDCRFWGDILEAMDEAEITVDFA